MMGLLLATALATPVTRHAVVVGSDVGAGTDAPLHYAERDAERFADVLRRMGQVRDENLIILRSPDAEAIRSALLAVASRTASHGEGEALLTFFYSGHADSAGLRTAGTTLPLSELTDLLEGIPVDVRVAVVDACQSGQLTRRKGARATEPFRIQPDEALESDGIAVIASSSDSEDAQESERLGGGVFTHHLITGLRGAADHSQDGRVSLTEGYRYAYAQTLRTTTATDFVQHPSYAFDLRGRHDVILTWPAEQADASLTLNSSGEWWVFDEQEGLVAELNVQEPAALGLPGGDYLLRYRRGGRLRQGTVGIGASEAVFIQPNDLRPVSTGASVRKGWTDSRAVWSLGIGSGVSAAITPTGGSSPTVALGVWGDFQPLTLGLHAHASTRAKEFTTIRQTTRRVGLDASAVRKVDWGLISPMLGLHIAVDGLFQDFETRGRAPSRRALVPRTGPVLGVEVPLSSRWSVATYGSIDVAWLPVWQPSLQAAPLTPYVVPSVTLEVSHALGR